jgi:hypothetical protein
MPSASEQLQSLRLMLKARREEHKEVLASGRSDAKTQELVGACKELLWTIEALGKQIRQINGDTDDDD